jgi:hypothetical protein
MIDDFDDVPPVEYSCYPDGPDFEEWLTAELERLQDEPIEL